jgi:hypothetical protein
MDTSEPRLRHRGYFLNVVETDADPGEEAAAEGVTIRVRISRPRLKRRASGAVRRTVLIRPSRSTDRHPATRRHSS